MQWVVAYDIADDRRRGRVLKILRNYGGNSVQKSVVEGEWDAATWESVFHRVRQVMKRDEDTVLFYRQCKECYAKRVEVGIPPVRQELLTVVTRTTPSRRAMGHEARHIPKANPFE